MPVGGGGSTPALLIRPPLPTAILYSVQFRSQQETNISTRSHGKIRAFEQSISLGKVKIIQN